MNSDPWKVKEKRQKKKIVLSKRDIENDSDKAKSLFGLKKSIWIFLLIFLILIIARNLYYYSPLFKDLV